MTDRDEKPEVWAVRVLWDDGSDTTSDHRTWPEARKDALQLSCLRGVKAVKVVDPHGDVYANYDRWSNRWHEPRERATEREAALRDGWFAAGLHVKEDPESVRAYADTAGFRDLPLEAVLFAGRMVGRVRMELQHHAHDASAAGLEPAVPRFVDTADVPMS